MVFVETRHFTKWVDSLLDDDSYAELQAFLAIHPEAGNIMRGTGGIRKVRWSRRGQGKRGGIRVIYYWQVSAYRIYLLAIFGKNVKDDLSAAERATWRKIVEAIEK